MEQPTPNPAPSTEDKTVAIVAYCTLIGFIIAIVLHGNNKTKLGAYHLRQALGLVITAFATWIAAFILMFIPFIGWALIPFLWIGILVLWIMGLINAASGHEKPIPLVGPMFAKMFSGAFA